MMTTRSTVCALALLALGAATAQAQTNSRADVKAEAAANAASTASRPMGEKSTPNQDKGAMPRASNTTREAVKADAMATPKAMGENSVPKQDQGGLRSSTGASIGNRPSGESRAAVRAEAASAAKPGSDKPMGQASQKDQDKGKTKP